MYISAQIKNIRRIVIKSFHKQADVVSLTVSLKQMASICYLLLLTRLKPYILYYETVRLPSKLKKILQRGLMIGIPSTKQQTLRYVNYKRMLPCGRDREALPSVEAPMILKSTLPVVYNSPTYIQSLVPNQKFLRAALTKNYS